MTGADTFKCGIHCLALDFAFAAAIDHRTNKPVENNSQSVYVTAAERACD
jgi:hypothetical protein